MDFVGWVKPADHQDRKNRELYHHLFPDTIDEAYNEDFQSLGL